MKLSRPDTRSWLFAGIVALVLGVLVLIDNGSLSANSGLESACRVEVTADTLNVRATPEPGGATTTVLHRGDLRGAETTVQNGYRQLVGGGWALDDFLRPLPGSKCAAQ
ncbi:MAG TPA: SH3 domain-containing protein [Pseudonocardia sp.]|nr:SH3 domain-containing protein [Pseudonocardia sp.]